MEKKYTNGIMAILDLAGTTFTTKMHIRDKACKF